MTASKATLLFCDFQGCNRSYTGSDRLRSTRRDARRDGWAYVTTRTGPNHDYCPKHARPVSDLFAYTGRHTAEGVAK